MIKHDSMRGWFVYELFKHMKINKNIYLITGDLGYKVLDNLRRFYPKQILNAGAAEQTMLGMAVGLALSGKIALVYSITPFLLYRPFETVRNYINYEKIPVKLIGTGRGKDYFDHGFCHWAEEDKDILKILSNIEARWPATKEDIPALVEEMIKTNKPYYVNLKRS